MIKKKSIIFRLIVSIDNGALGEQMVVNEITVHALLVTGVDVKKSEVHGLTQRGNKVVVHLRYGSRFYSPVISHRLRSMLRWRLKRWKCSVLSTMLPVVEEVFLEVMRKRIPHRFLEANLKAFAEGRKLGRE